MNMDVSLFHGLNDLAGRWDGIDDLVEFLARSGPFLLIALAICLWVWPGNRNERELRQWGCISAALSSALALGVDQVIIRLWDRPRPFMDGTAHLLLPPNPDPSFPSDHAAFAFAVAMSLWLVNRKVGWIALVIAVAMSIARVYAGIHYPADVAGGALVGIVVAVGMQRFQLTIMRMLRTPLGYARRLHLAEP